MTEVFIQPLTRTQWLGKRAVSCRLQGFDPAGTRAQRFRSADWAVQRGRSAIHETVAANIQVEFETAPEVVSGIELSAGGQKVAWSIADYLATLQKSVGELLREDAKPESKPDAKPKPATAAAIAPDPKVVLKPEPKTEPKPGPTGEPTGEPLPAPAAHEAVH